MSWHIEDWMSKHCYPEQSFETYEDARAFIQEQAHCAALEAAGEDTESEKYTEVYDGVCEDLYAVEDKE